MEFYDKARNRSREHGDEAYQQKTSLKGDDISTETQIIRISQAYREAEEEHTPKGKSKHKNISGKQFNVFS